MKKRFAFIDWVRAIGIFLVILFHFLYQISPNNSFRVIGFVGVSLFFIASGFVLAKNHPREIRFSFKSFFRRYSKMAVMYYLALIAIVILFSTQCYSGNAFLNLFSHFTFIDSFFPQYSYGIISPAWFLAPLLVYYFLFPFLNRIIKKAWWIIIPIFILMIIERFLNPAYTSVNILFFLGEFCFGIAFAHKKRWMLLLISLLVVLINPIMFLPFLIFFVFSYVNDKYLRCRLVVFISIHTLILFLFHEALLNLIFGKWTILGLERYVAIVVYLLVVGVAIFITKKIEQKLN